MAGKVKTWVWIIVAGAVVCVLGLVVIAGVGFYFVSQHIDTSQVSAAAAAHEFDAVKTTFAGQQPLVELDSRGHVRRTSVTRPAGDRQPPERLYLLAFDPDERRIVRFNLPFWLLRIKAGNATIDLNGNRMDLEDLKLSVEDLERFGPALIVDHQGPDGTRVLVWSK